MMNSVPVLVDKCIRSICFAFGFADALAFLHISRLRGFGADCVLLAASPLPARGDQVHAPRRPQ